MSPTLEVAPVISSTFPPWNTSFELDLNDDIKRDQHASYVRQRYIISFNTVVIVRPYTHARMTHRSDCSTWTTKFVDNKVVSVDVPYSRFTTR